MKEIQMHNCIILYHSIGSKNNLAKVQDYLKKSAEQNNIKGKLVYALFLNQYYFKNKKDLIEKLLNECCESGYVEAYFFYALYLENSESNYTESFKYYRKAADQGHYLQ